MCVWHLALVPERDSKAESNARGAPLPESCGSLLDAVNFEVGVPATILCVAELPSPSVGKASPGDPTCFGKRDTVSGDMTG